MKQPLGPVTQPGSGVKEEEEQVFIFSHSYCDLCLFYYYSVQGVSPNLP